MRFKDFKQITESQFNSKQEVIDHFVKQGKSAASGAAAWERGWRGSTPKKKSAPIKPTRSYHDDLDDKRYGEHNEGVDELEQALAEAALGINVKRPARSGSRPPRGHNAVSGYKTSDDALDELQKDTLKRYVKAAGKDVEQRASSQSFKSGQAGDKYNKADPTHKDTRREKGIDRALDKLTREQCDEEELEEWKASRKLCMDPSKSDDEIGASALSSCKSQGFRARDGKKSHKVGSKRITVGGKKIKGKAYGGPLPDYGTRK